MNFKQKKLFPILFLSLLLGVFGAYSYLVKAVSESVAPETAVYVFPQKLATVPDKILSTSHHMASRKHTHFIASHQKTPVITQPIAQVETTPLTAVVTDKSGEFEAGLGSNKINETASDVQLGIRAGAIAPNIGIVLDLTAFPIHAYDHNFVTRFSLGAVKNTSDWMAVLYVNELVVFETSDPELSFYAGAGLNLPLTNGSLGFNFLVGLDHDVKLFGLRNESLFLETGLNTYAIDGESACTYLNLVGGYKFSF
ncbi:MAG: hypothetical protein EXS67_03680 [Candidatus Margulisbacteria bacterium]|nr:hypothetical protein [Candidatus Margulisiibacteriota bacterium]